MPSFNIASMAFSTSSFSDTRRDLRLQERGDVMRGHWKIFENLQDRDGLGDIVVKRFIREPVERHFGRHR